LLFRSTFCILACDVDRTRLLHPFESYPPLFVSCLFPWILSSSVVRQAFQMDIKYILTTAVAAKLKRYYEHIFGVTAIFRVSSQSLLNLYSRSLHCSKNWCTNTLCISHRQKTTAYHSCDKRTSYRCSQTNSCI